MLVLALALMVQEPLALKGAYPGMSLEEFRALRPEPPHRHCQFCTEEEDRASQYQSVDVWCTGDPVPEGGRESSFARAASVHEEWAVGCTFWGLTLVPDFPGEPFGGAQLVAEPFDLTVGGSNELQISYSFDPAQSGTPLISVSRLIESVSYSHLRSEIERVYGPSEQAATVAQNQFGARFQSRRASWSDGTRRLELQEHAGDRRYGLLRLWWPEGLERATPPPEDPDF